MRLFIVETSHDDYEEHDPFIVLAQNEEEAKELVIATDTFKEEKLARLRTMGLAPWADGHYKGWYEPGDKPSIIGEVEEIPLNEAKIVFMVFNPG